MNFAIVGATGNVGRKTIQILEKSKIKIDNLFLVASKRSAGKIIAFKKKKIKVEAITSYDFTKAKITIFAAGSVIAKKWAPVAAKKTIVIDNSKHFRMDKNIALVVPEVNEIALKTYKKRNIIANPNCSTAQLVLVLKPLHDKFKIKRVVVSTYQAVSGAGKVSMDELFSQTRKFLKGQKVKALLRKAPGCKVVDTQKNGGYITPFEAEGSYLTYISRIRRDNSNKKAINL